MAHPERLTARCSVLGCRSTMRLRWALPLAAAFVLIGHGRAGLASSVPRDRGPSSQRFLIVRGDGPTGFQIGSYRVSAAHDKPHDPALSLATEIRALGEPSSCVPEDNPPSAEIAFVEWKGQHLDSQQSPGNLTPYRNPCSVSPSQLWVSSFRVGGRSQWHTNRGLRVGSSAATFHRLYPKARHMEAGGDWGIGEVPLPSLHVPPGWNPAMRVAVQHGTVMEIEVAIYGAER